MAIAGMAVFSTLGPWYIRAAIDDLAASPDRGLLLAYALLIISITAVQGSFRFLMRRLIIGASRAMEYRLRGDIFSHLLELDANFYNHWRTGDIMSRLTNDLNAVRMAIGPGLMNLFSTGLMVLFALIMMLRIDARLTLFAFAPLPVLSLLVRIVGRQVHARFQSIQTDYSGMSAMVQENLSGIRVVKAYTMEEREIEHFKGLSREYMRKNISLARYAGLFMPGIQIITGFTVLLLLWVGGRYIIASRLSLGEFVAFMAYLAMLTWPMAALGWVVNLLQRGEASMGRINEVLRIRPRIADPDEPVQPKEGSRELVFENVDFSYNGVPVLKGINLRIRKGEVLGVVGPTGSGKSTLVKLIPRLYDTTSGRITLGGEDLCRLSLDRLRRMVGYVPQEPFLFSATIRENISLARDIPESADPAWAAALARFDRDIDAMPAGYDTPVGERGVTLSGGQKQKAALSRAVIKEPEILVLDDALSSMDTESASRVLSELTSLAGEKTIIIVSHRIPQVSWADRILVLEEGRITAQGTHSEVLSQSAFYRRLQKKQLLEEEFEKA